MLENIYHHVQGILTGLEHTTPQRFPSILKAFWSCHENIFAKNPDSDIRH